MAKGSSFYTWRVGIRGRVVDEVDLVIIVAVFKRRGSSRAMRFYPGHCFWNGYLTMAVESDEAAVLSRRDGLV